MKRFRALIVRLLVVGVVLCGLLVGARYAYSVFSKFGFGSPLAWNATVAGYAISASARADYRAVRRLAGLSDDDSAAEMQNENLGEMRVPITREALRMVPTAPVTEGDEFKVTPGLINTLPDLAPGETVAPVSSSEETRHDWLSSAGGDASQRHSPLTQINASNVANLKLLSSLDSTKALGGRWDASVQASPLAWDRYVFWLSADQQLIATDAVSGAIVWHVLVPRFGFSRRGFLIMPRGDGSEATLYVPFGPFIGAFDARTGKLDKTFAGNGVLKLSGWTVVSPVIWHDTLVVGLYDARALIGVDLQSGETRWTLPLHGAGINFEGGTQWGGMTIDRATNLLYVTLGNPRPALIGITRPGPNKNSNSLLAVDLTSRTIKWTFQEVAHDLWDLDLPAAPALGEVTVRGRRLGVVATVTKMGNTILLDRASGAPVFDFRWRKAPKSRMVNDQLADYQPDLELPEPLIDMAWDPGKVTNVSDDRRQSVERQFSEPGTIYGRFRGPELNKDMVTFGVHGGAEWHGASLDPADSTIYVPVNSIPWVLRVYLHATQDAAATPRAPTYQAKCASCHLASRNGQFESVREAARKFIPSLHAYTILEENRRHFAVAEFTRRPAHAKVTVTQPELDQIWEEFIRLDEAFFTSGRASMIYHWRQLMDKGSLPGSAPPWSKVVALNLATGRKLWEVPLGEKIIDGKPVATGGPSYGGLLGTAGGLLFVVGTDDKQIRAIDKKSGATLWSHRLVAAGSAPPISFEVNGKQYIAVIASGGKFHNFVDRGSTLYVFGL